MSGRWEEKCFVVVALSLVLCLAARGSEIKVFAEKVNLRSGPSDKTDPVGVVSKGTILSAGAEQGDWVQVVPPNTVSLYVFGELVRDGVVAAGKAPIRAGSGINYRILSTLSKGDAISVKGAVGEWLKIAPPKSCYVWINKKYTVAPLQATPGQTTNPPGLDATTGELRATARENPVSPPFHSTEGRVDMGRSTPAATGAAGMPAPRGTSSGRDSAGATAAPGMPSGKRYEGILLKKSGILSIYPSKYLLVAYDSKGRIESTWYVEDSRGDLDSKVDKSVVVYAEDVGVIQGVKYPVLSKIRSITVK